MGQPDSNADAHAHAGSDRNAQAIADAGGVDDPHAEADALGFAGCCRYDEPHTCCDAAPMSGPARRGGGTAAQALTRHVEQLRACVTCPRMLRPAVSGGPVLSKVMLVGQAPGSHEPVLGRPFAWTAGRAMFKWFYEGCGVPEEQFRRTVYMAAVCRCFPGGKPGGGDRVPDAGEIANCSRWLRAEFELLAPELVIPVGKLAIAQFLTPAMLTEQIGRSFRGEYAGRKFDVIPLPHPSGASPWPRVSPGKELTAQALALIAAHPAFRACVVTR